MPRQNLWGMYAICSVWLFRIFLAKYQKYINLLFENLKFRRPEESVLFYNENLFVKVGDGNQFIKNIEFGTGIEEKCIFEDFVSQDQIISLGYLPDEERRADILADIIDIKNIKVVKE